MPKRKSRTLIEDFATAAAQCIVANPPAGFPVPTFALLVACGRLDEATAMLKKFIPEGKTDATAG
jgi:hypothetical protein